jgi:hypothetical protein
MATREIYSGPFCIRNDIFDLAEPGSDEVPLHDHAVAHHFQVKQGAARVEITDGYDGPVISSIVVRAEDEIDFFLIEARKFHRVKMLVPGTRTQCLFVNLVPVALQENIGLDAEYDDLIRRASEIAARRWRTVMVDPRGRWLEGSH